MKKVLAILFPVFVIMISSSDAKDKTRSFYLTKDAFTGGQALTACASGYHMASLWEILDVSNLRYNTALGATRADSGFGPPIGDGVIGWIRTGNFAAVDGDEGRANCDAYSSDSILDRGTVLTLSEIWNGSCSRISPWIALSESCDSTPGVWCVQD